MARSRSPMSLAVLVVVAASASPLAAQQQTAWTPLRPGSDNMEVLGHRPLGPQLSVADMELEQELDRPYAYVARMQYGDVGPKGMDIVDISDPERPDVIYEWRIEDQDLHLRTGGMDVKYFKLDGRYYVVQSLQFGQGGPDSDLGAVVLDVTGLPDVSTVREVARIRAPDNPGGFHNIFIYKHSDGRVLLMTTVRAPTRTPTTWRRSSRAMRTLWPVGSLCPPRMAQEDSTISTPVTIRTPGRTASTGAGPVDTTSTISPVWIPLSSW